MIVIKKKQIEVLMINLLGFHPDNGMPNTGLLLERLSLGTKRRLTRIHEKLAVELERLKHDDKEVKATYEGDGEKIMLELDILYNETVSIDVEPALMSEIEKIETEKMYDFPLIELIAK